MADRKPECTVRDGLFLEPCWALADENVGPGRGAGIHVRAMVNMTTGKPSRTYAAIKTPGRERETILNHCPFCGASINAMWREDADSA